MQQNGSCVKFFRSNKKATINKLKIHRKWLGASQHVRYVPTGKNLTTPAPPTTVAPTEPTPIPFDPTKLEQIIVFLHYNISQSKPELLEILKNYVTSAEYPPEGTIKPPLRYVSFIDFRTMIIIG